MGGRVIALIVFLVLAAIVAGLYASGPKYMVETKTVQLHDQHNRPAGTETVRRLRRLAAWERVYYAVVGSSKTPD